MSLIWRTAEQFLRPAVADHEHAGHIMNDNRSAQILVVEDDPFVRDFAVMVLEESGFQVRSAENADKALDMLGNQARETAVVFTDVQMPGKLDGLQLAHIVSDRWPSMTVLVTSGTGPGRSPLPAGTQFLPKPWNADAVISAIKKGVARCG